MALSLIRVAPRLSWPAQQLQTVRLAVTVRAGLALTDYGTFTLTVREDPKWDPVYGRRWGTDRASADWADPVGDGWVVSSAAEGTIADATTVTFSVTVPPGAGERRYAVDVVAAGGAAGRVQLVNSTWLTVTPSLLA